jgi:hypothetical protein
LTTADDKEAFLSRWSRRKLGAKEQAPDVLPAAASPAAAVAAPPGTVTEPAAPGAPQSISAEYRQFFDPQVEKKLRQAALRKLFSDPHFNIMDGLDTYIDDYSLPDPIPEAMLRQLNQAKGLFLFDDEKNAVEGAGDQAPAAPGSDAAAPPTEAADTTALPQPAPAVAFAQDAGAAAGPVPAPPAKGSRNG